MLSCNGKIRQFVGCNDAGNPSLCMWGPEAAAAGGGGVVCSGGVRRNWGDGGRGGSGYLGWVCIGVAAKLLTAVGVLRPMLLSPLHASG